MANRFRVGQDVFGLWPGSGLYFKGVIESADYDSGKYDVKFEEGTVYTLLQKHVMRCESVDSLKSKARVEVRRRARSSSTSRSRSRSRSRTPGRSPGRPRKRNVTPPPKDSAGVIENGDNHIKEEDFTLSSRVSRRRTTRTKVGAEEDVKKELTPEKEIVSNGKKDVHHVEDLPEKPPKLEFEEEQVVTNDAVDGPEEAVELKEVPVAAPISEEVPAPTVPMSTSDNAALVALGTFVMILVVAVFQAACQKSSCMMKGISSIQLSDLANLYDPIVCLTVLAFILAVKLLEFLPFGKTVVLSNGIATYRANAVPIIIILCALLATLKQRLELPSSTVLQYLPQTLLPTVLLATGLSMATYRNTASDDGSSKMQHFFIGSSSDVPLLGGSVKVLLNRLTFFSLILINFLCLETGYEKKGVFSPTLTLTAGLQIVYAVEALWHEGSLLQSFEYRHLQTGWALNVNSLLYPLLISLISVYSTNYGVELPAYALGPIAIMFIEGFVIKAYSLGQKAAFINNPDDAVFEEAETLTTASGERLLISGWWGCVRHPNYLGDIIIHWAFALLSGFRVGVPFVIAIIKTGCMLYRAKKNDQMAKMEYGPSWDRYSERVRSLVFPRLF